MIISIDGLGVNGKSTLARKIADELHFKNFNTGAIYRCIALEILKQNLDINNIEDVIDKISNLKIDFSFDKVFLNNEDVTSKIRTELISVKSTEWATIPKIKELVRKIQIEFLKNNNTVIEGRDIGTRIAPNADVKFYLYSDFETRVNRLLNLEKETSIEEIRRNLKIRDDFDINGGNFVKPAYAIEIDTSQMTLNEVYDFMMEKINNILFNKCKN